MNKMNMQGRKVRQTRRQRQEDAAADRRWLARKAAGGFEVQIDPSRQEDLVCVVHPEMWAAIQAAGGVDAWCGFDPSDTDD